MFDDADVRRRKSSLVPGRKNIGHKGPKSTACFVHSLLSTNHESPQAPIGAPPADTNADKGAHAAHTSATHSRLLTKKQLSEMAWGVRRLSKKLGSVRLKLNVSNVFVLTKAFDSSLVEKTNEIVQWLLSEDRGGPYNVYVEDTLRESPRFDAQSIIDKDPSKQERLRYWTNELVFKHPHTFDFVITLGGDGTLLYASWLFQRIVPPVLSFSMGSLGFLTKFDFANFRGTLTTAFTEGVTVSLRLRFEGTIMRTQHRNQPERDLVEELIGEEAENSSTHKPEGSFEILNDIVVDRGPNPSQLEHIPMLVCLC